eukprot:499592-Rhodomonas_salina.1
MLTRRGAGAAAGVVGGRVVPATGDVCVRGGGGHPGERRGLGRLPAPPQPQGLLPLLPPLPIPAPHAPSACARAWPAGVGGVWGARWRGEGGVWRRELRRGVGWGGAG